MKMYPRVFIRRSRDVKDAYEVHLLHSAAMVPDNYTLMQYVLKWQLKRIYRLYSIEQLSKPGMATWTLREAEIRWAWKQDALGNKEAWSWLRQKRVNAG